MKIWVVPNKHFNDSVAVFQNGPPRVTDWGVAFGVPGGDRAQVAMIDLGTYLPRAWVTALCGGVPLPEWKKPIQVACFEVSCKPISLTECKSGTIGDASA